MKRYDGANDPAQRYLEALVAAAVTVRRSARAAARTQTAQLRPEWWVRRGSWLTEPMAQRHGRAEV